MIHVTDLGIRLLKYKAYRIAEFSSTWERLEAEFAYLQPIVDLFPEEVK